jgi:hypothetical protein
MIATLSPDHESFFRCIGKAVVLGVKLRRPESTTILATAGNEVDPLASRARDNGAPKGVMIGTTAIARGTFGAARVFCLVRTPSELWLLKARF